ncbi:hypothetical protein ALI22I_18185 [Saccharothrix sp. ALI-22-I]|uniref:hypothetical protein n=1 Tax=Saccharothrix sp. ALI-22-I TaxID=1933778 RepID=UPI00097C0241|nr:hypothetical protein [Saccharothrix sp. ALI-22-I]ONI88889.1 hypothetical protein ALI22I_18185 [Saccharothrix sp. ALI-22-I]
MTYPQQPPGGQDPYGPPAQYGAQQYGAQQYGGGYGGGFNVPPPTPPKKKTGVIVAVVAVVVLVLGGLGFTGFVQPGFFLAEGGTTTTPAPTTPSAKPEGTNAQSVLKTLVDGLDSQDAKALKGIACASSKSAVDDAIGDVSSVSKAKLLDSEEVSADEVKGIVDVTADARAGKVEVTITRDGGDWCWQDIEFVAGEKPTADRPTPSGSPTGSPTGQGTPTAGGKPVAPEALAAMQSFLDSVNAGDAATAKSRLCADAIKSPEDVDELVGYQPSLKINTTMEGISSGDKSVQLYLTGTAKGQKIDGYSGNLWMSSYEGPWCVHAFRVVVI